MRAFSLRFASLILVVMIAACAGKDTLVLAVERGDWEEAWAYELPRAEAGISEAQVRVATMYARGMGRDTDMAEAVKFAILAAENDGFLSERISPAILSLATTEQREEGMRRAEAFETTPLPREWRERF